MDILEFNAAYEWFLLRACFVALAALMVAVVCFKVYEHIGRLKAAAKRHGWSSGYPFYCVFSVGDIYGISDGGGEKWKSRECCSSAVLLRDMHNSYRNRTGRVSRDYIRR